MGLRAPGGAPARAIAAAPVALVLAVGPVAAAGGGTAATVGAAVIAVVDVPLEPAAVATAATPTGVASPRPTAPGTSLTPGARASTPAAQEAGPAEAEAGELVDARMAVDVGRGGPLVELSYRLRPAPGATGVPLRVLPLAEARPADPVVSVGGGDWAPVSLAPDAEGMLEGWVPVSPDAPGAAAGGDGTLHLLIRYRVVGTADPGAAPRPSPVRVPLLAVPWPPSEALPGTFTVTLTLPPGRDLDGGFPATWVEESAKDVTGGTPGSRTWRAELPVLPALVSFGSAAVDAPAHDPGFPFWGLFGVFLGLVAAYVAWMILVERRASVAPESPSA